MAKLLSTSEEELHKLCDIISSEPEIYYIQWKKETKKGKTRSMVKIHGRLREILDVLTKLIQRIRVPFYVHGGVPCKSTITNARPHLGKPMVVRVDLEKHFPSVSPRQVYGMFCTQQDCSPDVARILTRLTTLNGELPQGSPTSVTVSNLVTLSLTKRLRNFAQKRGTEGTQYVDDYIFSGKRRTSKYVGKITKIVTQAGFKSNPTKIDIMPESGEQIVTGIRVNDNKPDIPISYVKERRRELASLQSKIEMGSKLTQKTTKQLESKIQYISQFNRGIAKHLKRKLNQLKSINR